MNFHLVALEWERGGGKVVRVCQGIVSNYVWWFQGSVMRQELVIFRDDGNYIWERCDNVQEDEEKWKLISMGLNSI